MPPVPVVPVAGPRRLPLLGNLPAFGRNPLAFLERLRDEFGDVVTWSLGPMKIMSLTHPEHIAELLGSNEGHFENLDAGWAFKQLVGKSVMRSQGAAWRRKRSLVQPSVRPSQVRRYASTMVDCAVALADRWQEGTQIDVLREMDRSPSASWSETFSATTSATRPTHYETRCPWPGERSAPSYGASDSSCRPGCLPPPADA
ncbi:cytochrome P450 [Streptomyces sp. NPDC054849]